MKLPPVLAARGVYYLPWYGCKGEIYLAAVNRHARKVFEVTVPPGEDPIAVERELWKYLAFEDPAQR